MPARAGAGAGAGGISSCSPAIGLKRILTFRSLFVQ